MKDAFEKYSLSHAERLQTDLLEAILTQLVEVNENLKKLLGARIAPSG